MGVAVRFKWYAFLEGFPGLPEAGCASPWSQGMFEDAAPGNDAEINSLQGFVNVKCRRSPLASCRNRQAGLEFAQRLQALGQHLR